MSASGWTPSPDYPTFTDMEVTVYGFTPRVLLCFCNLCGLLVGSRDVHREWHESLAAPASAPSPGDGA